MDPRLVIEGETCKGQGTDEINVMPFNISFSGKAKVREYFLVETCDGPHGSVRESTFRGRSLKETALDIPKGYHGIVSFSLISFSLISFSFISLEYLLNLSIGVVTNESQGRKKERFWRVESTFDRLSIWNADSVSNGSTPMELGIKYLQVAELLHSY